MEKLTFFLRAFGFSGWQDLKLSTFGFAMHKEVLISGGFIAFFTNLSKLIQPIFGVEWAFFIAYVGLVLLEWLSGVLASIRRGDRHESRKLGRMLLKVFIYSLLVALLHQMTKISFPKSAQWLEVINPFSWLYWLMIVIIIWQLWVSVLENLDSLGFRFAKIALKVINRKLEKNLNLHEE